MIFLLSVFMCCSYLIGNCVFILIMMLSLCVMLVGFISGMLRLLSLRLVGSVLVLLLFRK